MPVSMAFGNHKLDPRKKPDPSSLRQWIVAIAAVRFDLELGQLVEDCYPHGALSLEEESDVAFSSFPDSMSSTHHRARLHDTVFFFKIRRRGIPPPAPRTPREPRQGSGSAGGSGGSGLRDGEDGDESSLSRNRSQSGGHESSANSPSSSQRAEPTAPTSSRGPGSGGPRFLYGFVFNRQRHDERLRRGGEQKSVVVLTERPYASVFRPLVQVVGPLYFDRGEGALEQVALLVSHWPAPQHGANMELAVGEGRWLRVALPPVHTLPPSSSSWVHLDGFTAAMAPSSSSKLMPQGVFHDSDLFSLFRGLLMHLWLLWELVLVGEPLLVVSPSVSQCSEAVAALVSLISPLPCAVDFRPYFTIHDPDFPSLNKLREGDKVPAVILGVTNLFFLKALKSLPNVVSVGTPLPTSSPSPSSSASSAHSSPSSSSSASGAGNGSGSFYSSSSSSSSNGRLRPNSQVSSRASEALLQLSNVQFSPLRRITGAIMSRVSLARTKRDGPISLMSEHREAVWTNYDATTRPDTNILNALLDPAPPPSTSSSSSSTSASSSIGSVPSPFPHPTLESLAVVNNEMLRRHFVELTTNFLAPFGPFLRASAPPAGASPFVDPPPLPPFDAHTLLEQLQQRGGPGTFLAKRLAAGRWRELYRRFMVGPNFMPWFQRRRAVAEAEQHKLWRRARCEVEAKDFVDSMEGGQLEEAFGAVEKHIQFEVQVSGYHSQVVQKLRVDLRAIFDALPRDSQQKLLFNPQHAALLQGRREPSRFPGRPSLTSSRDQLHSNLSESPGRGGSHSYGDASVGSGVSSPISSYRKRTGHQVRVEVVQSRESSSEDLSVFDLEDQAGASGQENGVVSPHSAPLLKAMSSSFLLKNRSPGQRLSVGTRSVSISANSTPRRKESNPNSPLSYTLTKYFDWSPRKSNSKSNGNSSQEIGRGTMSYFGAQGRISDNSSSDDKDEESVSNALDPNPFNPLF